MIERGQLLAGLELTTMQRARIERILEEQEDELEEFWERRVPEMRPIVARSYDRIREVLSDEQRGRAVGVAERPLGPARFEFVTGEDVWTAALEGRPYRVRGMVNFGANLTMAHGDSARVRDALQSMDVMVHTDLFMSPTAEQADIVLPVTTTHERNDIGSGEEGCGLPFAQRLQRSGELCRRQVGDAGASPAVAHHVHRPPLAIGDVLRETVGQRILGASDADARGGGVAEHDQAQSLAVGSAIARRDGVVHVEARMHRQELHPAQAHELHGHDAGEGADEGAQYASQARETTVHALTVANADG